jgi:hypothetical protein
MVCDLYQKRQEPAQSEHLSDILSQQCHVLVLYQHWMVVGSRWLPTVLLGQIFDHVLQPPFSLILHHVLT